MLGVLVFLGISATAGGIALLLATVERVTGHHWAWAGTLLLGLGHIAWVVLKLAFLPEPSALQVVYGGVGVALVTMPMLPAVRRYLRS